ncbi:MAG: S1C family serine protease [bacterium]
MVVSKDGYIITNKHVVQDTSAAYIVTLFDGTTYPVDKVWFDDDLDIAIIKIVSPTEKNILPLVPATFLPISTTVSIGQFALTMGNSLGIYPNTVSL